MGEYEPKDSRIVTQNPSATPIEPERTGPREGGTRGKGAPAAETRKDAATGREGQRGTERDDMDRWQVTDENRRFEPRRSDEKDD